MIYKDGDVLFQDLGCGAVCDAINGVTPGWRGAEINHCGIAWNDGADTVVLEAISPKVRRTPLQSYLQRALDDHGRPRVLVARLRIQHAPLIPSALEYAATKIGIPYDPLYAPDGKALYCSELILDAFRVANGGTGFFPMKPMTFKNPATGEFHPFWLSYYASFGVPVPEGEIGSNPGDLSLSPHFENYTQLGNLRGLPLE